MAQNISQRIESDVLNQIESVFTSHKDTLVRQLNDIFFSCAFDNIHTLSPRRLSQFGLEEYHHFVEYLSNQDSTRASEVGKMRAEEGLCIQSILKMTYFYIQFSLKNLDRSDQRLVQAGLNAVFDYAFSYIEGFSAALRKKIIQQQTEIRQALSTALTEQREALFIRNYSIDSSINGILLTNLDGRVTHVNPSFVSMWQYSDLKEVLKTGDLADIAGKEVEDIFSSLMERGSWRGELQLERKDGVKFDVEMSASRIIDESGNLFGTMASFVDITERKRIEAQFRRSHKMNALGQLAAGITHDFNNMFAVVRGYLQLIMMEAEEGSQLFQDVQQIKIAMERSSGLTKQLQYFARGVTGERQPINLNAIIMESHELLKHTFPLAIGINLLLENDIWTLTADASQMSHVIINFCVNARDAIMERIEASKDEDPAAGRGTIAINTRNIHLDEASASLHLGATPGKHILLSISDDGTGMSSAIVERLFEPFYTTKKNQKNSGLGLSIIYGIVDNLKGHIDVQSEVGRGSTFNVYLPASDTHTTQSERDENSPSSSLKEDMVLLVDDEPQLLEIISRFLTRYGYRVIIAKDGVEAIAAFKDAREKIGLVILDLVMPEMSGEICFKEIRKIDPTIKVVLITGFTNDDSSYEEIKDEVVGIIEKPFDLYKLTDTIKKALQIGN